MPARSPTAPRMLAFESQTRPRWFTFRRICSLRSLSTSVSPSDQRKQTALSSTGASSSSDGSASIHSASNSPAAGSRRSPPGRRRGPGSAATARPSAPGTCERARASGRRRQSPRSGRRSPSSRTRRCTRRSGGRVRRHGFRILKTLCRVSLSPDSCVRKTTSIFEKWGMPSLVVAKFVPGFSTVAPPLAGATNARFLPFLLYDGAGALVWAGAGVAAGMAFHRAIDRALEFLTGIGSRALVILGVALLLFVGVKWWQRRRFYLMLRMARISPAELRRLMDEGRDPIVLDVRTQGALLADPRRIPGARLLELSDIPEKLAGLPQDREIGRASRREKG